jgi:hypothetical protein
MKIIGYWIIGTASDSSEKHKVAGDSFVSPEVYDTGYYQNLGYQMIPSYVSEQDIK